MKATNLLYAALCLFVLSCETGDIFDFDFSQPEVSSSSPSNHESNVAESAVVTVTFSKSMDTMKTANAFSLASESGRMKGYFTWEGDKSIMTFHPSKNLVRGEIYTISISTDAEDSKGNDLRAAYSAVFYAGGDTRPPLLVTASPANGEQIADLNLNVILQFSEPIDLDTLYDGISISPPVQGRFTANATEQIITFDPTYPLSWGTTYTVTVGSQLKDVNGNAFQGTHQFRFTVGNDFTAPAINSVTQAAPFNDPDGAETGGINCTDDIVITFSEPIEESSLFGSISISSPADYYIVRDPDPLKYNVAHVKLREPLESEYHYTLKISKAVTDPQGNALAREYVYAFFTNHADALRPVVSEVLDEIGDPLFPEEINMLDFSKSSPSQAMLTVQFSKVMDKHSIKVTIKHVMGINKFQPRIVYPEWITDSAYRFTMDNVESGNAYSVTIEGGEGNTRDDKGNYMKEDSVWYVSF